MTNVLKANTKHHTERNAFFDGEVGVQRYDVLAQPILEKYNNQMLANFWRPEEVDVTKDKLDYAKLDDAQKRIFTHNLKRQIVLDSVQGREPVACFMQLASTPEAEASVLEWSHQELIHSRSYTHIIRGVLNSPSEVFDGIEEIEAIVDLADSINKYYEELDKWNFQLEALKRGLTDQYDEYAHKKAFWLAINAVNALEGVRFYVSFACSWAFQEVLDLMEGNAKIIKLICRDENIHLKLTQTLISRVLVTDPDFQQIREETRDECQALFMEAAEQEKAWADELFAEGSMLGLNKTILCEYVDWVTDKRMRAVGLNYSGNIPSKNPLPWTEHWIAGDIKQTALQEAENDSYLLGVLSGHDEEEHKRTVEMYGHMY